MDGSKRVQLSDSFALLFGFLLLCYLRFFLFQNLILLINFFIHFLNLFFDDHLQLRRLRHRKKQELLPIFLFGRLTIPMWQFFIRSARWTQTQLYALVCQLLQLDLDQARQVQVLLRAAHLNPGKFHLHGFDLVVQLAHPIVFLGDTVTYLFHADARVEFHMNLNGFFLLLVQYSVHQLL